MKGTVKLNREFRYAYSRGKKVVTPALVMHCNKNRTGITKYGITASTAIGKANKRNRAKRLIREAYRYFLPNIKRGYNIIFAARAKTAHINLDAVKSAMGECLEKAGLFKDENN